MIGLQGCIREYEWGSHTAIPAIFGQSRSLIPVAELWFGAHPDGSALCVDATTAHFVHSPIFSAGRACTSAGEVHVNGSAGKARASGSAGKAPLETTETVADASELHTSAGQVRKTSMTLQEYIAEDPIGALGRHAVRNNNQLPYLVKLIAPERPLSLQVHPSLDQARAGFERENRAGIARTAPERNYKDANHKPELIYALTRFEALAGLRTTRRVEEILSGLDLPLTNHLLQTLRSDGVSAVFSHLLSEKTRPGREEIAELVGRCRERRLAQKSPSVRADNIAERLAADYPDDPGVVASLLMNPVTLRPGESLFIPAGTVHAYLSGLGVEIMSASDNVLRAGLTSKHVDVPELLRVMDQSAVPPIRVAPEKMSLSHSTFYVPVDDFELSVVKLTDALTEEKIRARGPRIILCLEGAINVFTQNERCTVNTGKAVFIRDDEGPVRMRGVGKAIIASVP